MLTITQFTRAVLPHGTTGAFIDPHEIANVLGLVGVRLMADEARTTPMQIYVQIPSCVPAAPSLESAGASIGPKEVAEAMTWPGVIGLGEVMNYPGVAAGDKTLHAEIAATLRVGKVIGGHLCLTRSGIALPHLRCRRAEHFGVAQDVGCIAPGRYADILIVSDQQLAIDFVIAAGEIVTANGKH